MILRAVSLSCLSIAVAHIHTRPASADSITVSKNLNPDKEWMKCVHRQLVAKMHKVEGMRLANTCRANFLMDNPAEYFRKGRRVRAHTPSTIT